MRLINNKVNVSKDKFLISLVIVIFFVSLTLGKHNNKNLIKNDYYTIGVILRKTHSKGSDMEYVYFIKGEKIKQTGYSRDKKKRKIGGRFFVISTKTIQKVVNFLSIFLFLTASKKHLMEGGIKSRYPNTKNMLMIFLRKQRITGL